MECPVNTKALSKQSSGVARVLPTSLFVPFEHQIAGHGHDRCYGTEESLLDGIVRLRNDRAFIFKRIQANIKGFIETSFYQTIQADPRHDTLRQFVATYYGAVMIGVSSSVQQPTHLQLSNAVAKYHRPSIIDCKMGRRTYDEFANDSKRRGEFAKYPFQLETGFRVAGLYVSDTQYEQQTRVISKSQVRAMSSSDLRALINTFAQLQTSMDDTTCRIDDETANVIRTVVLPHIISRLHSIHTHLTHDTYFRFYSSSLLITYESDRKRLCDVKLHAPNRIAEIADVKMIDFAHVCGEKRIEWNKQWLETHEHETIPSPQYVQQDNADYLFGLQQLIKILESVAKI